MGVFGRRGLNRCSFPPTSCCRPKISDFRDLEVPSALRRVVGRSPIFRDDETAKPSRTTLRSLALAPLSSRGSAARTVRGASCLASKMWIKSHRQSEALPSLRSLRSRRPRHLLRRFLGPLTRLRLVRGAITDVPLPDRDDHALPNRFLRSLVRSVIPRASRMPLACFPRVTASSNKPPQEKQDTLSQLNSLDGRVLRSVIVEHARCR